MKSPGLVVLLLITSGTQSHRLTQKFSDDLVDTNSKLKDEDVTSYMTAISSGKKFESVKNTFKAEDSSESPFFMAMDLSDQKTEQS